MRGVWLAMMAMAWQIAGGETAAVERMAAAERAFAAATAEIGIRDGFLTFFATDAVHVQPGTNGATATVVPARDRLIAARAAPLPLTAVLEWAPFTGQASSDGSLGWLTGAYATRTLSTGAIGGGGAYFSVWRRQTDGTYRVWLDEGIPLPEPWRNAAPFRPMSPAAAGATGADTGGTVVDAERLVADGGDGWRARLATAVRIHRAGTMPIVGHDAARTWAAGAWHGVRFTLLRDLTAASDDLAVTLGGYDATTPTGAEHGTWVRIWQRDPGHAWRIVFETSTPAS